MLHILQVWLTRRSVHRAKRVRSVRPVTLRVQNVHKTRSHIVMPTAVHRAVMRLNIQVCVVSSHEYSGLCRFISRVSAVPSPATAPASEGEAVIRSPKNMAVAKIPAVDFIDLY